MNIQTRKKPKVVLVIGFALTLLLALGGLYYYYARQNNSTTSSTTRTSSKSSSVSSEQTTSPALSKDNVTTTSQSNDVDTQKQTDEIPESKSLSVNIHSLAQSSDGTVSYEATTSPTSNGTCSAIFTNEIGKPVTRNGSSNAGKCSASIPAAEFDAIGKWTMTLRFYKNDTQAVATKDLTIK